MVLEENEIWNAYIILKEKSLLKLKNGGILGQNEFENSDSNYIFEMIACRNLFLLNYDILNSCLESLECF